MSGSRSEFVTSVVRRALEDQLVSSPEQLKEWFNDFVDLHEEDARDEIATLAANDPRAQAAASAGRGRKKSMVFSMLQGQGALDASTGGGSTRSGRTARIGSNGGSAAKRMMMNTRAGSFTADEEGPSATPFSNLAARRKSRAIDLGALRASMTREDSFSASPQGKRDSLSPPQRTTSQLNASASPSPSFSQDARSPSKSALRGSNKLSTLRVSELAAVGDATNDSGSPNAHDEPNTSDTLMSPMSPGTSAMKSAGSQRKKKKKSGIRFSGEETDPADEGAGAVSSSLQSVRVSEGSATSNAAASSAVEAAGDDVAVPAEPSNLQRFSFGDGGDDEDDKAGDQGSASISGVQSDSGARAQDRRLSVDSDAAGDATPLKKRAHSFDRTESSANDGNDDSDAEDEPTEDAPGIQFVKSGFAREDSSPGSGFHSSGASDSGAAAGDGAAVRVTISSAAEAGPREPMPAPAVSVLDASDDPVDVAAHGPASAKHGKGITFVTSGFADNDPTTPLSPGMPSRNASANNLAAKRNKRLVSFGGFSVTSEEDDQDEHREETNTDDDCKGAISPNSINGSGTSKAGFAKNESSVGLKKVKTATMGARLLQKLTSKKSMHKSNSLKGSLQATLSPRSASANVSGDPEDHEGAFPIGAVSTRSGVAFAISDDGEGASRGSGGAREDDLVDAEYAAMINQQVRAQGLDLSQPATACATVEELELRIDDGLSTLELRDVLLQDRYFTLEQLQLNRFNRVISRVGHGLADFSIALIFFTAYAVAARVGLGSDKLHSSFVWFEMSLDILNFVLVLGVNLFMPYEEQGQVRSHIPTIVRRYLSKPQLAVFDFISTFPMLIIVAVIGKPQAEWARFNLLLRELKLPLLFEKLEEQLPATLHPSAMRLLSYFMYLVLIVTHLSTFLMFIVRGESESDTMAWMERSKSLQYDADPWYWFSRFWLHTLSLIANKSMPYPINDGQVAAALVAVIVGVISLAVILATFDEIIVTEIEEGNILGKKVDDAIAVMDELRVPRELQLDIIEYYKSMWDINRSFDFNSDDLLAELPDQLHDDIEFECNARIIRSIPLFADVAANKAFVRLLAGELRQLVIMPGAPIVTRGEDGDCMFFVSSGLCSVMSEDNEREEALLSAGSFFGEVTLLFGGERDRTINAKTLCVCYVVTDVQFEEVVEEYPEALDGILKSAVRQMKQSQRRVDGADDEQMGALMRDDSQMGIGGGAAADNNSFGRIGGTGETSGDKLAASGDGAGNDDIMTDDEIRNMMISRMKFGGRSGSRRTVLSLPEYDPDHRRSASTSRRMDDVHEGDGDDDDHTELIEAHAPPGTTTTSPPVKFSIRRRQLSNSGSPGMEDRQSPNPFAPADAGETRRGRADGNPFAGPVVEEMGETSDDEDEPTSPGRSASVGFGGGGLNFVVQRNRRASVGFALKEAFQT